MRRHYITHPQFQIGFTISFVTGVALIFVILGAAFVSPLYLLSMDSLITPDQQTNLLTEAYGLSTKVGLIGLITFIPITIFALYLSYKFVGPINRIESWLMDVVEKGTPSEFKVRPGDELEKIITLLNELLKEKGTKK